MINWLESFVKLRWLKSEGVTWSDWWSSRTNKTITILTSVYMAILNGSVSLTDLGVPVSWNAFILSVAGLVAAVGLVKLRDLTDSPLEGRSIPKKEFDYDDHDSY